MVILAPTRKYFGSVTTTMLSLFMSISGGVSWEDVLEPLRRVSEIWVALFITYVPGQCQFFWAHVCFSSVPFFCKLSWDPLDYMTCYLQREPCDPGIFHLFCCATWPDSMDRAEGLGGLTGREAVGRGRQRKLPWHVSNSSNNTLLSLRLMWWRQCLWLKRGGGTRWWTGRITPSFLPRGTTQGMAPDQSSMDGILSAPRGSKNWGISPYRPIVVAECSGFCESAIDSAQSDHSTKCQAILADKENNLDLVIYPYVQTNRLAQPWQRDSRIRIWQQHAMDIQWSLKALFGEVS